MGETTNGDDIQDMYVRWIVWGRGPRPSPRMQMSGTLPFGSTRDFRPSPMGALAIANPDGQEGPLSGTLTPQFSGAMGGGGSDGGVSPPLVSLIPSLSIDRDPYAETLPAPHRVAAAVVPHHVGMVQVSKGTRGSGRVSLDLAFVFLPVA
jgi:hypothetical protein